MLQTDTKSPPLGDVRRENLRLLAAKYGSIAEVNVKLNRSRRDPYLYSVAAGIKNKSGAVRTVGPKMCLEIEKALGLPLGWMSEDHGRAPGSLPRPLSVSPEGGIKENDALEIELLHTPETRPGAKPRVLFDRADMAANFPGRTPDDFRGWIVSGDIMAPRFIPGDRLLIDLKDTTPAPGFFVLNLDGRKILRTLTPSLTGELMITTEKNPAQCIPLTPGTEVIGRAAYWLRGGVLS